MLGCPVIQKTLQPWSERVRLLLKLAAEPHIVRTMMVLQECRILEIEGQRDFHQDFTRRPGRPGKA